MRGLPHITRSSENVPELFRHFCDTSCAAWSASYPARSPASPTLRHASSRCAPGRPSMHHRPAKTALLQTFRAHPQSATVPHQGFQTRFRFIGEQEQVPAQRILSQMIAHQPVQPFKSFAHIDGFHRDVDLGRQALIRTAPLTRFRQCESTAPTPHPRIATNFRSAARSPSLK